MKRLCILGLLAACTQPVAPPLPTPPVLEDTCNATQHRELIGQDATALEKVLILGMVRVIRPGDFVTQDYQPARINFMIADNETIRSINCG